jgi:hypothetical protein
MFSTMSERAVNIKGSLRNCEQPERLEHKTIMISTGSEKNKTKGNKN